MTETIRKPFVYACSTPHLEIELTEDGFTISGHKISHEEMDELDSTIFYCRKVLEAHGIYREPIKVVGK